MDSDHTSLGLCWTVWRVECGNKSNTCGALCPGLGGVLPRYDTTSGKGNIKDSILFKEHTTPETIPTNGGSRASITNGQHQRHTILKKYKMCRCAKLICHIKQANP